MKAIGFVLIPPMVLAFAVIAVLMIPWDGRRHASSTVAPFSSSAPKGSYVLLPSQVIEQVRAKWGIPKGLIEAIISIESGWDETKENPEKGSKCYKSGKGSACVSVGLMQVQRLWHGDHPDPFDNIRTGVNRQLGPCWKRTKNIFLAAKCYNGKGPQAERYAMNAVREYQYWKHG